MDTETMTRERKKVLALYRKGKPVREIAVKLELSTQRVYQQLKRLRELGVLPDERQES
jgi:DNA-binding CsgD family transcriptional regulator